MLQRSGLIEIAKFFVYSTEADRVEFSANFPPWLIAQAWTAFFPTDVRNFVKWREISIWARFTSGNFALIRSSKTERFFHSAGFILISRC